MKPSILVGLVATVLGLTGAVVVLIVTGHDPSTLITTLPVLVALAANLYPLDKIRSNTNGTLSDLRSKNEALTAENAALRSVATPAQISQVAPVVPVTPVAPAAPIVDPIPVQAPSANQ